MQNINLDLDLATIEKMTAEELVQELKNTFTNNVFTKFSMTVEALAKKFALSNEKATIADFSNFCVETFFKHTKRKVKKDGSKSLYSLDKISKDIDIAIDESTRLNAKQLSNAIQRMSEDVKNLFYREELTEAELQAKQAKQDAKNLLKSQQEKKQKQALDAFDVLVSNNLTDIAKLISSVLDEKAQLELAKILTSQAKQAKQAKQA